MKYNKRYIPIYVLIVIVGIVGFLAAFYTINMYRPKLVEELEVAGGMQELATNEPITVVTYNIGYAGLSENETFFMDGGEDVEPESKTLVEENMLGILEILKEQDADIIFMQEVDRDSKRSYHIDLGDYYPNQMNMEMVYATNFRCVFVPYPIPPIGKVESGVMTMTNYTMNQATRIALPDSFKWPVNTCNLKRCILETRMQLKDSDKELILLNFHLDAYDDGTGKQAQTKFLMKIIEEEYQKGNYVIAGGDFNQTFQGIKEYPVLDNSWIPETIQADELPEHFSYVVADNAPTCRLLNMPFTGDYETSQVYIVDGFIVSDNVLVNNIGNVDVQFRYTDHQPVKMQVLLIENEEE